jgi:hypothetical protein
MIVQDTKQSTDAKLNALGESLAELAQSVSSPLNITVPWLDSRVYPTLTLADAAATATGILLIISSIYDVPVGLTLNASVKVLPGGGFTNAGAININGPFEGCFNCFRGAGSIVYGKGSSLYVEAEWRGAKSNDVLWDSTNAMNRTAVDVYGSNIPIRLRNGTYYVSGLKLWPNISIYGSADRGSVIKMKTGATGAVIYYDQSAGGSYTFNTHMRDFSIAGTGQDVDTTNDGLVLSPLYGLDGCQFDNILIKDCGGWGLKIVPSAVSAPMVLQQTLFNNITVQTSKNGVKVAGFIGNIQWNSCTFDNLGTTTVYAFKSEVSGGIGAQDMTFVNCSFQFAQYGFYTDALTCGTNFLGCHFEGNSSAHMTFNSGNMGSVSIINPSFNNSPQCIVVNAGVGSGSKFTVIGGYWSGLAAPSGTDRFISCSSTSAIITLLGMQSIGNALATQTTDPYLRIYGSVFGQDGFQRGGFINSIQGLSSTVTRSRNVGGRENVTNGATFATITIIAETDTAYRVVAIPSWSTTVYSNPLADYNTGTFILRFGTAVPTSGHTVTWFLFR